MKPHFSIALRNGWRDLEAGHFEAAAESWRRSAAHAGHDQRLVLTAMIEWSEALSLARGGHRQFATEKLQQALTSLTAVTAAFRGCDLDALKDGLTSSLEDVHAGKVAVPSWSELEPLGTVQLEHQGACPFCGEPVQVAIPPEEEGDSVAVEDCPVCCRPMVVRVHRLDGVPRVTLEREDG